MTTLVRWIEQWREVMLRVAIGYVDDPDTAEEIVQQASVAALEMARRKLNAEEWVRNPRGWLTGITRNVARSYCRTRVRREAIRRRNEVDIRAELYPHSENGPDYTLLRQRTVDIAERFLTDKQRRVVRAMLDGMADDEIARAEGMARRTVRWHRYKAIQGIREHIP